MHQYKKKIKINVHDTYFQDTVKIVTLKTFFCVSSSKLKPVIRKIPNKAIPQQRVCIKKFVVKNCSKERPGSIVKESLKNIIFLLIDASKELDFYADFKYICFVKFSLTYQKIQT